MSGTVIAAMGVLAAAIVTGGLTYIASRRTTDDSRAINLINAGQISLEAALRRATDEIMDARGQIAALRTELAAVRAELEQVLHLHAACEEQRGVDAVELAMLRQQMEGR